MSENDLCQGAGGTAGYPYRVAPGVQAVDSQWITDGDDVWAGAGAQVAPWGVPGVLASWYLPYTPEKQKGSSC